MKKIIRTVAVLAIGAIPLLGVTSVSAASKGTDRPYMASGQMSGSIDRTFNWSVSGPSIGTHYGQGPTFVSGSFIAGTSTFEVTAADGDKILGEFVSQGAPVGNQCPDGWSPFSDVDRFTGGTGRFENATGDLSIWGCTRIDLTTGAFDITFTARGTINY